MIAERVAQTIKSQRVLTRPTSFWASRIGHPCPRHLYHSITDWDKAAPPPDRLIEVFAEGRAQERSVEIVLAESKFRLIQVQTQLLLEDPPVSGRVDGRIVPEIPIPGWPEGPHGPRAVLYEVKAVAPHSFARINTLEDMLNSNRWYERMWPAQLQIYLHVLGEDVGVLLLKDKTRMALKDIWVKADPTYVAQLLDRARKVYAAIQARQPPERVEGPQCRDCEYWLVCRPDIFYGQAQIDDSEELAALLDRRAQLQQAAAELRQVERRIKELLGDRETVIAGNWLVESKWVEYKAIPARRVLRRTYTWLGEGVEGEEE